MSFVEVRDVNDRLLFKYDAARKLIEIKSRGMTRPMVVDLAFYDELLAMDTNGGEGVNPGVHGKRL